jgi:hypothetical protein
MAGAAVPHAMLLPFELLHVAVLQLLPPLRPAAATAALVAAPAAVAASMQLGLILCFRLVLFWSKLLHLQNKLECRCCMVMTALLQEPAATHPTAVSCYCSPQTSWCCCHHIHVAELWSAQLLALQHWSLLLAFQAVVHHCLLFGCGDPVDLC